MDWTQLTQNGVMLYGSVNAVMKLSFPSMFPVKAKAVTKQQSLKILALSYRHTLPCVEYISSKK